MLTYEKRETSRVTVNMSMMERSHERRDYTNADDTIILQNLKKRKTVKLVKRILMRKSVTEWKRGVNKVKSNKVYVLKVIVR